MCLCVHTRACAAGPLHMPLRSGPPQVPLFLAPASTLLRPCLLSDTTLVTLLQRRWNRGQLSPSPGQPFLASSVYHLLTHQTILNFYLLSLSALDL